MPIRAKSSRARWVLAAALLLGSGGGAYAIGAKAKATRRADTLRAAAAADAAREATVEALMRELDARNEAVRAARDAAARATNETDRAAAMKTLSSALEQQRRTAAELAAAQGLSAPAPGRGPARVGCSCDAGDPDCSML
jgi:hypothetical protein